MIEYLGWITLVVANVYIIGALMSWWTFLGVPVSFGRLGRR